MATINQRNYSALKIRGVKDSEIELKQDLDYIIIEEKSIPELLNFIKENYNL